VAPVSFPPLKLARPPCWHSQASKPSLRQTGQKCFSASNCSFARCFSGDLSNFVYLPASRTMYSQIGLRGSCKPYLCSINLSNSEAFLLSKGSSTVMKSDTHAIAGSLHPPYYVVTHPRKDSKLHVQCCERTESLLAIKQRQGLQTPFKIR
jgi:hypothetical protein